MSCALTGSSPGSIGKTDTGEITRELHGLELCGHGVVIVIKEFGPDGTRVFITEVIRHNGFGLGRLHLVLEDLEEPALLSRVELPIGNDKRGIDKIGKSVSHDLRLPRIKQTSQTQAVSDSED